jgi:hypothetical protein
VAVAAVLASDRGAGGALPPLHAGEVGALGGRGGAGPRGTGRCPGSTTTIDATLQARDGEIGVAPDLPLGSLSTVKVFSAPGSTFRP